MRSKIKTNAMRKLDEAGVAYEVRKYDVEDGAIDGLSVARKLSESPDRLFKTLVTWGGGRNFFVFVIPVNRELDLKAAARAVGVKSIEMVHVQDILPITGYIRGGCSPLGMKKAFPTVLDSTALEKDSILVSGGKIGYQIVLAPRDLIALIGASTGAITR
jgi:Cys-tRNA(Pro)/Cys-tRNA(Cys) deacylase